MLVCKNSRDSRYVNIVCARWDSTLVFSADLRVLVQSVPITSRLCETKKKKKNKIEFFYAFRFLLFIWTVEYDAQWRLRVQGQIV